MSVDLLGRPLDASEVRLLAAYEELKALCAEDLAPNAAANVRAALALMHNVVNGRAQVRASQRPRRVMRIAAIGGGPGDLYFSILMRKVAPDCSVTVYERNRARDAFGFGVVFSDETLTVFQHADPETYAAIAERFTRWSDIDIHHRGTVTTSGWPRVLGARAARAARSAPRSGRCRWGSRSALRPMLRRWGPWEDVI